MGVLLQYCRALIVGQIQMIYVFIQNEIPNKNCFTKRM